MPETTLRIAPDLFIFPVLLVAAGRVAPLTELGVAW